MAVMFEQTNRGPRTVSLHLILLVSAALSTAGSSSPDLRECKFCKRCEDAAGRRRLPEFYPGVALTPRLSQALFGSPQQAAAENSVTDPEQAPQPTSLTRSHVHLQTKHTVTTTSFQSKHTVTTTSLQHRHKSTTEPGEQNQLTLGSPTTHGGGAGDISEGYDDDGFFDHESLFPEDERNSLAYAAALAKQGYRARPQQAFHHRRGRRSLMDSESQPVGPGDESDMLESMGYVPSKDIRTNLTMCETCSGCTGDIELWGKSAKKMEHKAGKFSPPTGRSSTWIFRASSAKATGGTGVAKVWCLPFKKGPGIKVDRCEPYRYNRIMSTLLGFAKLARDCGMQRVVPHAWVEHIRALMPGTDYVVDLPALFSDVANGVSARFLSKGADKHAVLDIFQSIKSQDVVHAAIFDLLVANCDRHADNMFIGDDGQLTLIDNDMSLSGKCIANSLFLPGTSYHAKSTMSDPAGGKARAGQILDMLDYRCHAEGGSIKTSYPQPVTRCLKKLDRMTVTEIIDIYGFANENSAAHLKLRAQQMLEMGFEWTLHKSLLHSGGCTERFLARQPCCKFKVGRKGRFVCSDPSWNPRSHQVGSDCQL